MTLVAVLMAELPRRRQSKQVIHGGGKGKALPSNNPVTRLYRKGLAAQDYRRSYANVWRRLEAGETPLTCPTCGCETDVARPAHDNRCEERESE